MLIKAKGESLDPFETLETVMGWDNIIASVEEAKQLVRPVTYDYIDLLDERYSHPVSVKSSVSCSRSFKNISGFLANGWLGPITSLISSFSNGSMVNASSGFEIFINQ